MAHKKVSVVLRTAANHIAKRLGVKIFGGEALQSR